MSKSYHANRKSLKGKTKKEIEEMINDPDSILHELVEKSIAKKKVKRLRKRNKMRMENRL